MSDERYISIAAAAKAVGMSRGRMREVCISAGVAVRWGGTDARPNLKVKLSGAQRAVDRTAWTERTAPAASVERSSAQHRLGFKAGSPSTNVPDCLRELEGCLVEFSPPQDRHHVYFLTRKGHIVYVGETLNLFARLVSHRRHGKQFDRVLAMEVPTDKAKEIERVWIKALNPRYNRCPALAVSDLMQEVGWHRV